MRTGVLEGASMADVLDQLRLLGLTPIEAKQARATAPAASRAGRRAIPLAILTRAIGHLSVMLNAGLSLDRALAVLIDEMPKGATPTLAFEGLLAQVREGRPLSRAMDDSDIAFPPLASAMAAAGEADGRLGDALAKLAATLERASALRATLISTLVYPAMLTVIAVGVISLMLFWVVPQFETLFSEARGKLPFATRMVLAVSHGAQRYGAAALLAVLIAAVLLWRTLRRPAARRTFDRWALRLPRLGPLLAMAESARFTRVLASLVGGGVALPEALAIARRSLLNTHMAAAVEGVARGLREGQGLTAPLAATGVFPRIALSYLRTGEETAQLPVMLDRLADTLDSDVRTEMSRIIDLITPLITVFMGVIVATIIASVMTAILGFDDLALTT